jgi:hypothetical protein
MALGNQQYNCHFGHKYSQPLIIDTDTDKDKHKETDKNMDEGTDTDMDTDTEMDIHTDLKWNAFVRYPCGAIVPLAPYGLSMTHHGVISNGAINL